jgi:hypothetical protein
MQGREKIRAKGSRIEGVAEVISKQPDLLGEKIRSVLSGIERLNDFLVVVSRT